MKFISKHPLKCGILGAILVGLLYTFKGWSEPIYGIALLTVWLFAVLLSFFGDIKKWVGIITASCILLTPFSDSIAVESNPPPEQCNMATGVAIFIIVITVGTIVVVKIVRFCQKKFDKPPKKDKDSDDQAAYKIINGSCGTCISKAEIGFDERLYYKLTFKEGLTTINTFKPEEDWTDFIYRIHEQFNLDDHPRINLENMSVDEGTREVTLGSSDNLVDFRAVVTLYVTPETTLIFEDSSYGVREHYFKVTYKDLN